MPDEFHERLSVRSYDNIEEVQQFYMDNYHVLTGSYGVLKFMYTVLLTKVYETNSNFLIRATLTFLFGFA